MSVRACALLIAGASSLFTMTSLAWSESPPIYESTRSSALSAEERHLRLLETVVVTGRQPGPGLWKVSRDGHVMWVLATWSPLPKRMEWDSAAVERRIAVSQELLLEPGTHLVFKVGLIGRLAMIPSAVKMRANPDGKMLQEVVSPQAYVRWSAVRARYIGSDTGVEKLRPYFASSELVSKAGDSVGVTFETQVEKAALEIARRHGLIVTDPRITVVVKDAKKQLKAASRERVDDHECFEQRLTMVERDLDLWVQGANAWAQGDVESMHSVSSKRTSTDACGSVVFGSELMQRNFGVDSVQNAVLRWVDAAESALARNTSTFAILSGGQVDSLLGRLAEKGYVVEAP